MSTQEVSRGRCPLAEVRLFVAGTMTNCPPYERCLFRGSVRKRNYNCICGCGTVTKFPLT